MRVFSGVAICDLRILLFNCYSRQIVRANASRRQDMLLIYASKVLIPMQWRDGIISTSDDNRIPFYVSYEKRFFISISNQIFMFFALQTINVENRQDIFHHLVPVKNKVEFYKS